MGWLVGSLSDNTIPTKLDDNIIVAKLFAITEALAFQKITGKCKIEADIKIILVSVLSLLNP